MSKGLDDANGLLAELRHRVMSPEDMKVIHNAGKVDQQNQWCTPEFGWDELQAHNRPFRLIKRFVITQASGKKRVIDDAASGGQSLLSQDGNKLQFCSALQPCAHVQTLAATTLYHFGAEAKLHEQVVTCGEDLPDVYHKIPMDPATSWACIVCYPSGDGRSPRFRRYHSMLFGLPLAVTAFNRLPFSRKLRERVLLKNSCSIDHQHDKIIADHQPLTTANDETIADHQPLTTANDNP